MDEFQLKLITKSSRNVSVRPPAPLRQTILVRTFGEQMNTLRCSISVFATILWAGCALADPCEAALPAKAGTVFTGTVQYIVDGDGICVGSSSDADTWIEVRLADFDAPEMRTEEGRSAKAEMTRLAKGKQAECVTTPGRNGKTTSYDRVIASCSIEGASLASLMREANVLEGGN